MENEDVIRDEMAETRTSLTEKLETLEKQVASTVQGATSNVTETVEAVTGSVKETVETVKDSVAEAVTTVKETVQETISTVKESVHEGVNALKGMLDVPGMVQAYPWPMFGASIAVGFLLEGLITKPTHRATQGFAGERPQPAYQENFGGEARMAEPRGGSWAAGLFKNFEPEIGRLKGLALGALMNSLRTTVRRFVPESMASSLDEVFQGVTQKNGRRNFSLP